MEEGLRGYRFADGVGDEEGPEVLALGQHGVSESSVGALIELVGGYALENKADLRDIGLGG